MGDAASLYRSPRPVSPVGLRGGSVEVEDSRGGGDGFDLACLDAWIRHEFSRARRRGSTALMTVSASPAPCDARLEGGSLGSSHSPLTDALPHPVLGVSLLRKPRMREPPPLCLGLASLRTAKIMVLAA